MREGGCVRGGGVLYGYRYVSTYVCSQVRRGVGCYAPNVINVGRPN